MWDLEDADLETFEKKVDPVAAVIETACARALSTAPSSSSPSSAAASSSMAPEGVPPKQTTSAAVVPASKLLSSRLAPALAPAPAPPAIDIAERQSYTSTIHQAVSLPTPTHPNQSQYTEGSSSTGENTSGTGSFAELSAFFKEQQQLLLDREAKFRQDAEAKIHALQQQMQEQMKPKSPITDEQLTVLQTRLEELHAAKLLSDDEVYSLEVCYAQYHPRARMMSDSDQMSEP